MSLFRAREWWSVNLNENESYDSQCLMTLTLESDTNESILLGNHKGVLRLFSPNSNSPDNGVLNYEASHLLLEVQLASPILQIGEGALVSGSPKTYLGVLHPRLFSVYTIKKRDNEETNIGVQMEIELVYQHILRHSAHSFVLGPFGGVRGRSFICIQSLDGLISFYEQESFAFQLYLPTFILPFTFAYIEKTDSFMFLNGSLIFECYTYETLASSGGSNEKKLSKTWEFNLGEGVIDINILTKHIFMIVVLSERNLWGINENGKMIFMKRLESKPAAFSSYIVEESKNLMIMLATEGGFINFYEGTQLKWSMKIDHIPVVIKRVFLSNLPGGITLLSEDGHLQIVYIGTHPSVYLVPPLVQPEIDIQKSELELRQLQQKIAHNDIVDPVATDLISIDLKIDKTTTTQNGVRGCNLMLELSTQCLISKIQILFTAEPPLLITIQSSTLENCSEKTLVENFVTVNGLGVVSDLNLTVIVTYTTSDGAVRSLQKSGVLPLELIVSEAELVKETLQKITISTNKPVCSISELFRELSTDETSPNAIALKQPSGDVVTILAAKSSQKYRLQADAFGPVYILLNSLLERLKLHFKKDISITYSGPLPLDSFYELISNHHQLVCKKRALEEKLSKQTSQYIIIQKKILTNLKDVTPKSSNLHDILNETSSNVKETIEELIETEKEMEVSKTNIRSMCRLMVVLLELMSIQKEDLEISKLIFDHNVQDFEDQGWLEVQEATISFLMRTILAKSSKDQQKPTDVQLEPLSDVSKLTKHFSAAIDRITKGTYLLERNDFEAKKEPLLTIQAAYESDEGLFDEAIPTTSKLLTNPLPTKTPKSPSPKIPTEPIQVIAEPEPPTESNQPDLTESVPIKQAVRAEENQPELETIPERNEREEDDNEEDDDDAIWDVKLGEMRI